MISNVNKFDKEIRSKFKMIIISAIVCLAFSISGIVLDLVYNFGYHEIFMMFNGLAVGLFVASFMICHVMIRMYESVFDYKDGELT